MSGLDKAEVVGKITAISGIVLIYSDNGKGEVRAAQEGDEILATDIIDASNGSYEMKPVKVPVEFLQNEDLAEQLPGEDVKDQETKLSATELAKLKEQALEAEQEKQEESKDKAKAQEAKEQQEKEELEAIQQLEKSELSKLRKTTEGVELKDRHAVEDDTEQAGKELAAQKEKELAAKEAKEEAEEDIFPELSKDAEQVDSDFEKALENLRQLDIAVRDTAINDGGGKFLNIQTMPKQTIEKIDGSVLGVDGRGIGTDAMGHIGMSHNDHLILQAIRSGGSGLSLLNELGSVTSAGISIRSYQVIASPETKFQDLFYEQERVYGEIIPEPGPIVPEPVAPEPIMAREMVADKLNTLNITDAQYDLIKGFNYAVEVDLNNAIEHLNTDAASSKLSITIPDNATMYLMPYAGYLDIDEIVETVPGEVFEYKNSGDLVYTKTDHLDGTVTLDIAKPVLTDLNTSATTELDTVTSSLAPTTADQNVLTALQTGMSSLADINYMQAQINAAKDTLQEVILDDNTVAVAKAIHTTAYKGLVALQTEFVNQNETLTERVDSKLTELINQSKVSYNELLATKNAIECAVNGNKLVLYVDASTADADADINYSAEVDGTETYNTTGVVEIDAEADGIQFADDGIPVGEVTLHVDHILDLADPINDKVQLNLTVNVNFIDSDNSENHAITVPLPSELVGLTWDDSGLAAVGWSYSGGSLIRPAEAGMSSINDTLTIEVPKADFDDNVFAEMLNFNIQFVSTETIVGGADVDVLDNNEATATVTEERESLVGTIMTKELGTGDAADWTAEDAAALMARRQAGYLDVQAMLTELKVEMDFIDTIYNPGDSGYEDAIDAVFNISNVTVTLSDPNAEVISGVANASLVAGDVSGEFVLTAAALRAFYDSWVLDDTKDKLYVGPGVEHSSADFTVSVSATIKQSTFDLLTDKKVIIDAVAEGIAEATPTLAYDETSMQAGPAQIKVPVNVQFTAEDFDASEKFAITLEIPDVVVDPTPGDVAAMNLSVLGWSNTALSDLTWTTSYDDVNDKTIMTTEVSGSFLQSVNGAFDENVVIAFDTAALQDMRNAVDGGGAPAPIDQFSATVKVQSIEVIPTDGSDKEFDVTDNISTIASDVVTVDNLPINTLFASEVQHDNDSLENVEFVALDFESLITASGKTATTITVQLAGDAGDALTPDIDVTTVKLAWLDGAVSNEVFFDGTDTFTLTGVDLTAWDTAGKPDLMLITPKYIAGTYDLVDAEITYSDLSTEKLYQNMEVRVDAVASEMTTDGVVIDSMELIESGGRSHIALDVTGAFLDTDTSENHQITILLPDGMDGKTLNMDWGISSKETIEVRDGEFDTEYVDKSDSYVDLGSGVQASISADGKSIIIDYIGASLDDTIYLSFDSDILQQINNFNPTFMVSAFTAEQASEILATDNTDDNLRQVFCENVELVQDPFTPKIIINELQEDPNSITSDRITVLSDSDHGQIGKIDISGFVQSLAGNASNARIEITFPAGDATGAKIVDQAGTTISPQANGKVVLTSSQLAAYLNLAADEMDLFLLPQQYAHEDFTITATGYYSNGSSYEILTNMPVAVNAKQLSEKGLAIAEKYYGSDHVETVWFLNSLGWINFCLGNYMQGKQLLSKGLATAEKYYAADADTTKK